MATTSDPLATLAAHALGFVRAGDVVGLGSGRAAGAFVRALAERVRGGLGVRGVSASSSSVSRPRSS
jgi:ribose 5-phosphate isomerase A